MTITSSLRNFNTRLGRKFSLSFWCGCYNLFLLMMLVASVVAQATVLSLAKLFERAIRRVPAWSNGNREVGGSGSGATSVSDRLDRDRRGADGEALGVE